MRLFKTITLLLLVVASARAEAPSVDGTMTEDLLPGLRPLLKEAVERSPNTIAASITVATAEANRLSAYSGLWPSVSLNSSYQETIESVSHSTEDRSHGLYYSGGIYQPIFEWGSLKNQAAIGNLGLKIAQRQYAEAYRLLAISIREQYLGLIGKNIQLRNALFNLKLSKEAFAAENARFESGAASQAELGNMRITQEQAQLDSDRAQEDFDYAKRVFTRLVGIDDLDPSLIPLELPHFELPTDTADAVLAGFVGNGIESTFQSEVFKMYIKQNDLSYSIAKVRLLPKFTAAANYSYSNQTSTNGVSISQVGVQAESYYISANWSIFDGFATRASKLAALAGKRSYERQRQTYADTMIDQITYMRHGLGLSVRALSLAEVHYNLLEAEVKRLGQDRSLGYASEASIDAGILNLYATDFQRAYARTDLCDRWTEFISLAGVDPVLGNISPRYVR